MSAGATAGGGGSSAFQPHRQAKYELAGLKLSLVAGDVTFRNCLFPADQITKLFDKGRVEQVLNCGCEECVADRNTFEGLQRPADYVEKIVNRATPLFALLVHIDHPSLIFGFLRLAIDDALPNPSIFPDHGLAAKYWPAYQHAFPQLSVDIESWFHTYKHQFSAPLLDPTFQEFPDNTVLPFVNQKPIGEGGYGRVYKLKIPDHYRRLLPHTSTVSTFARKELKSESNAAFWLEKGNLELISALFNDNKHVVRMIKPYRHRGIFNILFPCAENNLDTFLRSNGNAHHRLGPLEDNKVWHQMLGISKALRNMSEGIVNFKVSDEEKWIGYHFDLKPANILVFSDGLWKVSDFGQASFKQKAAASSEFTNQGGSDPYSAPEIQHPSARAGPKYDVWSLGCILLEVTVFLVRGPKGLTGPGGLDEMRKTVPPGARGIDSRLWQRMGKDFVVKPEIEEFMEQLTDGENVSHNSKSRQFLEAILKLIHNGMLEPDPQYRKTLGEVVQQLDLIINDFRIPVNAVTKPTNPLQGERKLGERFLGGKKFWYFPEFEDEADARGAVGVDLHLYEKQRGAIRITIDKPQSERDNFTIFRQDTTFVPIYAFDLKHHEYHSYRHFYILLRPTLEVGRSSLTNTDDAESLIHLNLVFSVSPEKNRVPNALLAQSAFTGQEVLESFSIKHFRFTKLRRKSITHGRSLFRSKHSKDSVIESLHERESSVVQLWRETKPVWEHEGIAERPRTRRIAIFTRDGEIHLLRMVKECMADEQPSEPTAIVKFQLTDPNRAPSFAMSVLAPPNPGIVRPCEKSIAFAGIPLDRTNLEARENETKELYESVELTFEKSKDAAIFRNEYKDQKYLWGQERGRWESTTPNIP